MGRKSTKAGKKLQNYAMKAITVEDIGDSILNPTQFNRFIRVVERRNLLLGNTRRMPMPTQQANIDRTAISGRVLKSGNTGDGAHRVLSQSEFTKPEFFHNELRVREFQGITSILDKTLRRIIEKQNFANTLTDMFSAAVGRNLEEFMIFADTNITHAQDDVLSKEDGWAKRAVQKVYGVESADGAGDADFDPSSTDVDSGYPTNMFDALIDSIDKKYWNPNEFVILVDWGTENAYRAQLRRRQTSLGDSAVTGAGGLRYNGVRVRYVPMLDTAKGVNELGGNGTGRIAMLQHLDNMVYGIFHEVTLEPSRHAEDRMTNYVISVEPGVNYEDENAAAVAYIEKPKPA